MPRKQQAVQVKKRQKTYRPGEMSGDFAHVKPRGVFRLFSNYRLFAAIGVVALTAGLLLAVLLGGGSTPVDSDGNGVRGAGVIRTTPQPGETLASGSSANTITYTSPPPMTIDTSKMYTAVIKTEKGDITVQLDPSAAPTAVNNFVFLAGEGFYDGVTFWRVVADDDGNLRFAQAGDPTGTGIGGAGYDLPYEETDTPFTAGTLAVARKSEAGSPNNGSQFFFTYQDEPTLDGDFTVFGQVIEGLDVLQQLVPRDPRPGESAEPGAKIESVEVSES
jgi:cyclophilin family peptidyl-prolyl cis-trans isomerase